MTVRVRDDAVVETDYNKPITVVKYINDAVVIVTPFGSFILSPTSVAYIDGENSAIADIKREGEKLRFEPRDAERIKDLIRAYLPEFLPPHLTRCGNKIYLGDVEVGTIYELH